MLAGFADCAIVRDGGQERRGLAGEYHFRVAVNDVTEVNGHLVVMGRVSGTFPGSPVDLRHFLTLDTNKITRLETVP